MVIEVTQLPQSIAEIDFPKREALPLLALDRRPADGRPLEDPDLDFDEVGHARVPALALSARGKIIEELGSSLVLVLHSAEDQSAVEDDEVLLEFFYEIDGEEQSVRAPLRRFLDEHLEEVLKAHAPLPPNLVLVMCNPKPTRLRRRLTVPTPGIRVFYADGDVLSWLDRGDIEDAPSPPPDAEQTANDPKPGDLIRLSADAWHQLG